MQITRIQSHVLRCDMPETLGYSQQFYSQRTCHLVEVSTSEGLTGWGECFGPGNVARANARIVEDVIAPMMVGERALDRDRLWHRAYNLLRDHGQKGMPIQALSGIDIALWDVAGQAAGLPLCDLIGGRHRDAVGVYGYGMMLRPDMDAAAMADQFADEAAAIAGAGFAAVKMKVGLGVRDDVRLATAVADAVDVPFMVDANHAYDVNDALEVGRALDDLGAYWFEEPVAPEDRDGYATLRRSLRTRIAGGEAEFTRWGWRDLIASGGLSIAQPEVCALGGVSEYLRVLALCHAHHLPVVNHVWGGAVAVACNLHLSASMPPLPGGLHPRQPWLEFDTTENRFRDDLLEAPLDIQGQVARTGTAAVPDGPGLGVAPDREFIAAHLWE
ncbi:mandelate racemase/muconate lactonizing enzyme family protein [Jannaschia sp. Os4]|uniref:mandelate racemase/muconate lactonizing enzyme family protein n=1 Tax=Jannaschia sp. Os4 TaxID=2807617 RepID=UPI001939862A|nr:mandelate racemase/muconate lactonizing enzyme family protein [Jannaschia sp. Os4]MBM2577842.1 mandelate racemase/muconate lactonizing enzyme family protein [Jannaschia sp. Os4]